MSAGWIINTVISALLLPPLSLILLALCGLYLRRRWPRGGAAVSISALLLLALLSTYPGAMLLIAPLENRLYRNETYLPLTLPAYRRDLQLWADRRDHSGSCGISEYADPAAHQWQHGGESDDQHRAHRGRGIYQSLAHTVSGLKADLTVATRHRY